MTQQLIQRALSFLTDNYLQKETEEGLMRVIDIQAKEFTEDGGSINLLAEITHETKEGYAKSNEKILIQIRNKGIGEIRLDQLFSNGNKIIKN